MRSVSSRRFRGAFLAGALLASLASLASLGVGAARAQQIDPSGTTWEAVGEFVQKFKPASTVLVRQLNGRSQYDSVTIFGPTSDPLLAADEFLIVVSNGQQGFDLTGTYTDEKPRKPKLSIDEDAAAVSIAAFIQAQWESVGLIQNPPGPTTVVFRSLKASAKNKVNNGLERIKTRVKAKGVVSFEDPGVAGDFKFQLKYSGKGFLVDVEDVEEED